MMTFIKKIEATGIYGRFDIAQEFQDGINILHGKNGAGKTTLLHILANALSGDFGRFQFLNFKSISIALSDGKLLQISAKREGDNNLIEVKLDKKKIYPSPRQSEQLSLFEKEEEFRAYKAMVDADKNLSEREKYELLSKISTSKRRTKEIEPIVFIAYFPAFRTMIEAWVAAELKGGARRRTFPNDSSWKDLATERARDWFGGFTPMVNFPSVIEIEDQLASEISKASANVYGSDQKLLSDAFMKILASLSETGDTNEGMESLFETIHQISRRLEISPLRSESRIDVSQLRRQIDRLKTGSNLETTALRVLQIYRDILKDMAEIRTKSFSAIDQYIKSVNEFLDNKSLVYRTDISPYRRDSVNIEFEDKSLSRGLRSLSSGERQIMTLIYAATHMSRQNIVLIDEPEISLHVDWQRKLISRMAEQMGQRQIIACTHSPVIGANHLNRMKELSLYPTKIEALDIIENIDDEEAPF